METKLLKDLHECSGMGYSICKEAIKYCEAHPSCSPLGYLDACYSGVKYSNLDKAIEKASLRLVENPPSWAEGTDICLPLK